MVTVYTYHSKKSKRQVPFLRVPAIKPGPEPTNARDNLGGLIF